MTGNRYGCVTCSGCGAHYRCTPEHDYYNATTARDGVCERCLLAAHGLADATVLTVRVAARRVLRAVRYRPDGPCPVEPHADDHDWTEGQEPGRIVCRCGASDRCP